MDEYGQIGPEKPDYASDVESVARHLARASCVDVVFTARMTKHHILLALLPLPEEITRAEEPILHSTRPSGFSQQPGIFVGIDGGRAAWLPATGDMDPGYVAQYLGTPYGGDSELADFINGVARYIYGAAYAGGLI